MTSGYADDRGRLLRALALSRRFHLYLVSSATPRAADELLAALPGELKLLRRSPVELARLDPYAGRATTAPLSDAELVRAVLWPLLVPAPERTKRGVVHIVDASRAVEEDRDAWRRAFSLWNEKRNAVQATLAGEVVVILPRWMGSAFAAAAPDVWSVRSGEYEIVESQLPTQVIHAHSAMVLEGTAAAVVTRSPHEWLRIPRLCLWGGEIVVRPWLELLPSDPGPEVKVLVETGLIEVPEDETEDEPGNAELVRLLERRREADRKLAQGRFAEAEPTYSELLRTSRGGKSSFHADLAALSAAGLAMAVGAQGRVDEARTIASIASTRRVDARLPASQFASSARSYTNWLAGHSSVSAAATLESARAWERLRPLRKIDVVRGGRGPSQSRQEAELSAAVQALEHGELYLPRLEERPRVRPPVEWYELRAERASLTGQNSVARALLTTALFGPRPAREATPGSTRVRAAASLAFLELVEGDTERAESRLRDSSQLLAQIERRTAEGFRAQAALEHTRGVLCLTRGDRDGAVSAFSRAEEAVDHWAPNAFDRPCVLRARAAARLGRLRGLRLGVAPDDAWVALAKELVSWLDTAALSTSEDRVHRVLAVDACSTIHHHLPAREAAEARAFAVRAAELAEPLRDSQIEVWQSLFATTTADLHRLHAPA